MMLTLRFHTHPRAWCCPISVQDCLPIRRWVQPTMGAVSSLRFSHRRIRQRAGGNITLEVADLLFLRLNSTIAAIAGTAQLGGNGGNITIREPFIIGVLNENSDIIASSQFGLSGTVTLNLLNVAPSWGLVALPINLTDPLQQISQTCQPGAKTAMSSFVATGRGGISLDPAEPLEGWAVVTQWVPLPETERTQERLIDRHAAVKNPAAPVPWVEANELIQGRDRAVELVAPASGQQRLAGFTTASCEIEPQR